MATFLTIITVLVVLSSLFKKKKKDEVTFPSQQINEQEEWSPFYSDDIREKQNSQKYDEVVNKVEKIKKEKSNVKVPTTKKKFDIKSAMIYSAIMERPYEY